MVVCTGTGCAEKGTPVHRRNGRIARREARKSSTNTHVLAHHNLGLVSQLNADLLDLVGTNVVHRDQHDGLVLLNELDQLGAVRLLVLGLSLVRHD